MDQDVLAVLLVFPLVLIFSYSSVAKLLSIREFVSSAYVLEKHPHVRDTVATLDPFIEMAIVGLLLFRSTRTFGLLLALAFLIVGTVYLFIGIRRPSPVYCNCFGLSEHAVDQLDVIRNLVLIVFGLLGTLILTMEDQAMSLTSEFLSTSLGVVLCVLVGSLLLNVRMLNKLGSFVNPPPRQLEEFSPEPVDHLFSSEVHIQIGGTTMTMSQLLSARPKVLMLLTLENCLGCQNIEEHFRYKVETANTGVIVLSNKESTAVRLATLLGPQNVAGTFDLAAAIEQLHIERFPALIDAHTENGLNATAIFGDLPIITRLTSPE